MVVAVIRIDALVRERKQHRVEVAVDLELVVDADLWRSSFAVDEALGRQRAQRCPVDALEELAPTRP